MFDFLKKLFAGNSDSIAEALRQGGTVIDVRTAAEFKGGSVKNAVNIPHTEIRQASKKIAKLKQPLILCCASGMRSGIALQELKSMGYEQVFNGKTWGQVQSIQKSLSA